MPDTAQRETMELRDLVAALSRSDGFADVAEALRQGRSAGVDGAWGSASALTLAALIQSAPSPRPSPPEGERGHVWLIVVPRIADVDDFAADLAGFTGDTPLVFPASESLPREQSITDAVFGGRLRVLEAVENGAGSTASPRVATRGLEEVDESPSLPVIITPLAALLQPVPSREERRQSARTLQVGEELDVEDLLRWLTERGFERVPAVEVTGEFSMRGGILDIFPPDAEDPLRIELFGEEIDSLRRFDAETQRTVEELQETRLTVMTPAGASGRARPLNEHLLDVLPSETRIALIEPEDVVQEGHHYLARLSDTSGLFDIEETLARCRRFPTLGVSALSVDAEETVCHLRTESIERFSGPKTQVIEELAAVVSREDRGLIACHNEGERQRLSELLAETDPALAEQVQLCLGHVTRGFRLVDEGILVLSDHELFGRTDLRRAAPRRRKLQSRAIDSFLELKEGDLVVHLTKGIARYRGLKLVEKGEQREEHLVLEFRDKVIVYVPVSLIHLVQKYVGSSAAAPELSKLGSNAWEKKKRKVAEAVSDLAADMLRLQAARESKPGIAAPPDSAWQHEFDAAFPFVETEDQLQTVAEVKEDMQRNRPMDRLICGDVGYGKTEIAMRAAFKTVEAGRQVAVLVPTTVLAEQHHRTFRDRMAEYPVSVDSLSRFKTKAEQRRILQEMENGRLDIVIGTHRLIQRDVRFKDLGLLIIDEEQRFGVEAKEQLKQMRLEVDVLTLSATPIPRTLHMSLLGIRDISNLLTAPQDRHAIETRISRFDPELIRAGIIRELNRSGQVYFVHNRVYNIQRIADRVQEIVPEARIGIAHGRMAEGELERAMLEFVQGRIDVLVCTTIIESGLDISNANTMFIHQADQFGLAEMHQLRGRVGRYKHRAYCYLLLPEGRPLTPTASRRLKAIQEFSELGAGFKIALRDLEIRGAGNILGTEQSGHIATVGYELYCRLLENAVRRLRNLPVREYHHVAVDLPITAFLPDGYIPPGRQKIEMYRKLSNVETLEELADVAGELRDRFGPPSVEVERLLGLKEVQVLARRWSIDDIHLEDRALGSGQFVVFGYRDARRIRELAQRTEGELRVIDRRSASLPLPDGPGSGSNGRSDPPEPDRLLEILNNILQ